MPDISIIVALADDLAIGKSNGLLCHIPGDLKRFKALTSGHTVIMGRHTLDSLPNGPLPDRRNIVITHNPNSLPVGCLPASSLTDALERYTTDDSEVFIIGGGQIYKQALPLASKLYLTQIHSSFPEADTFFPPLDYSLFKETFRDDHSINDKCPYSFSFVNLIRI